ncbi:MAG: hypothetical protein GY811_26430 [Myxococcales bacterium]|nr:hypothetical protein [Myxococcales bacterium]
MERIRSGFLLCSLSVALASCAGPGLSEDAICDPGENRCNENRYQVCGDRGEEWVERANCSDDDQICVLSTGCRDCSPNTRSCDGFDIVRCNPGGTGSDVIATCDGDAGDVCNNGICINACQLSEQSRDYEGCEYWAVDLDNAVVADQGAASAQQFSVVLSNASEVNALVDVEIFCTEQDALNPGIGCVVGEFAAVEEGIRITPGGLAIVDLDPRELDGSSAPNLNDGPGTFRSMHAYRVTSSAPLIAYQFNPLENVNVFSNDASLLLPTSALDDRYIVLGWPQTLALTGDPLTNGRIDLRAFLTIVAVEDESRVVVSLSTDILPGSDIPAAKAGDELVLEMSRGEVVNLETDGFNADFTGTEVRSNGAGKPVAVFVGSEASDSPFFDTFLERSCCADHLEQQVFPERTYGNSFIAVKSPSRSTYVEAAGWNVAVVPDEPEWWRVMATTEDTRVRTNLPPPYDRIPLQRGESQLIEAERDFTITANGPIAVAQVPGSQRTTGIPSTLPGGERPPGGDPSLILLPPIEQWRTRYLFLVPNKYAFDFLLMAAPMGTEILFDGLPLGEVVPGCEYEIVGSLGEGSQAVEYQAIRCPLSDPHPGDAGFQDDGVHTLEAVGGATFGLVVWGWDSFVSYGYPGGANLGLINIL